jgi:hypothetical protein
MEYKLNELKDFPKLQTLNCPKDSDAYIITGLETESPGQAI